MWQFMIGESLEFMRIEVRTLCKVLLGAVGVIVTVVDRLQEVNPYFDPVLDSPGTGWIRFTVIESLPLLDTE